MATRVLISLRRNQQSTPNRAGQSEPTRSVEPQRPTAEAGIAFTSDLRNISSSKLQKKICAWIAVDAPQLFIAAHEYECRRVDDPRKTTSFVASAIEYDKWSFPAFIAAQVARTNLLMPLEAVRAAVFLDHDE